MTFIEKSTENRHNVQRSKECSQKGNRRLLWRIYSLPPRKIRAHIATLSVEMVWGGWLAPAKACTMATMFWPLNTGAAAAGTGGCGNEGPSKAFISPKTESNIFMSATRCEKSSLGGSGEGRRGFLPTRVRTCIRCLSHAVRGPVRIMAGKYH